MDTFKRKLRSRSKSTIERVVPDSDLRNTTSHCLVKPNLKGPSSLNKKNSVNVENVSVNEPNPKRRLITPRSILKKIPLDDANHLENMPEVVIKNCKLTNSLFDLHKKFEEKCEDVVRINGQLCATTIENIKLKQELAEKHGQIEQLKKIVQQLESEKFCQNLIEFDNSTANEGLNSI